jgi:glycosyltransferase involved in cell wall biosynthesis
MHVEIVEPTLVSDAGHCAAIFGSLQRAAPDLPYRLWIDRRADAPSVAATGVPVVRHFIRPLRKLQSIALYRRLLRAPAPMYVPTATYLDLRAIDALASGTLPPDHVFLYFHKLRLSAQRAAALRSVAKRQPHLHLLGASPDISDRLRAVGFTRVDTVIPINADATAAAPTDAFRYVLFAGAARADKGFTHVVTLAEHLAAQGDDLPLCIQTTGDHYGRYDERTTADLARLRALGYPHLATVDRTPDRLAYANLFPGSICLQPYERAEYADKTSSVTFDALMAGAPVITLSGTPMARIVAEARAGIVVEDAQPQTLRAAALAIRADFAAYAARARRAGENFDPKRAWQPLIQALRRALQRA